MIPRLELRHICKRYPGVLANDDVSMRIMPGVIHAVLGENGAGKSTLMKIVYGTVQPDSGEIVFDGRKVERHGPAEARALGIEMVHQHFALFETMTVAENIAIALRGRYDLGALSAEVRMLGERYGLPVEPGRLVADLSVGERQRVEIIRCLLQKPRLLILDEPTSVLAPQAVERLFETLRQLAAEGCSILYISHKLEEIRALCDTATVLRGGRVTGEVPARETSARSLARMMVGSDLPHPNLPPAKVGDEPVLSVTRLDAPAADSHGVALRDITLEVRPGEIVGIAGVSGNGQAELVAHISGETRHVRADAVRILGRAAGRMGAAARRRMGLAFVPEERLGRGAVPVHRLGENAALTAHRRGMVRFGLLRRDRAREFAAQVIGRFGVKARGTEAVATSLSGGNLQKFIVGREIALEPRVFLVSQPTWGVDVGAAAFIRQTLIDLSRAGAGVLVVSEELDELFEVCDRLHVLCAGRLSPALGREEMNRETVGLLMMGLPAREREVEPSEEAAGARHATGH